MMTIALKQIAKLLASMPHKISQGLLSTLILIGFTIGIAVNGFGITITINEVKQREGTYGTDAIVDITYSLSGSGNSYGIGMIAKNGASTIDNVNQYTSGNVWAQISPGTNKRIVWRVGQNFKNNRTDTMKIAITATERLEGGRVRILGEFYSESFSVDTRNQIATADVVINFKKEAYELDQSCASAYWLCYEEGGFTTFPISSGEAWTMSVGTYTLEFHSGETAFADPEPIRIVVDGTQGRIERDVVITRKMVRFGCVFYNNKLDPQAGIQPSSLGLDSYCKWRLGSGEWHTSGEIVDIPTGPWNLEIDIDERIGLMAWADIIQKPILLDGTTTTHTEYINVVGENSAKAIFRFQGHSSKRI